MPQLNQPAKIIKAFSADISVEEGERAVVATISTIAVDRDGEVLVPQGCNSRDFEKNPIVFLNHDYWNLPVGKCVSLKRDPESIVAKTVFATRPADHPADEEWVPDTLFDLFRQGVIRGFSVGFIPMETRPATDKDIEKYGAGCRRVFSKWSLLEYSVAPLPANQEAIALAVSKGYLPAAAARGLFGYEAKSDNNKVACSVCGEMKPKADMTMVDDKPACAGCKSKKTALADVPPAAPKRVVVSVPGPAAPVVAAKVKRVHRQIEIGAAAVEPAVKVKRLIMAQINKMRGKIYE